MRPAASKPQKERRSGAAGTAKEADRVLGIRITHPDRVLFAEQDVEKIDLARYFEMVADRMMAFVTKRPLSLVRCPQGPQKTCFFQKHASDGFPEQIREVPIKEKAGTTENYLYVADGAGLVAAVQMGTLEFHVWGATIDKLETPERMIFDLDPDAGLPFARVKAAAEAMRARLAGFGLDSVPMVTGGKGVHVVVPLDRRAEWERVKGFAKALASKMAADEPDLYTATMSKAKREGRIFIDWLRNERGATAIAPYSTRSRAGAPVAMPVSWDELQGLEAANSFRIDTIAGRLEERDPWEESTGWRQSVTQAMLSKIGG